MGQSGHILRVIRTATNTAIEIPTRNHGGAIGVYGSVEQRSLAERAIRIAATPGSLTAVSTDGTSLNPTPLESMAAEQSNHGAASSTAPASPTCGMSLATMFLLTDTESSTPDDDAQVHIEDICDADDPWLIRDPWARGWGLGNL